MIILFKALMMICVFYFDYSLDYYFDISICLIALCSLVHISLLTLCFGSLLFILVYDHMLSGSKRNNCCLWFNGSFNWYLLKHFILETYSKKHYAPVQTGCSFLWQNVLLYPNGSSKKLHYFGIKIFLNKIKNSLFKCDIIEPLKILLII